MNAINESKGKGASPAGGHADKARELAKKQKKQEEQKPAPAGGKDPARDAVKQGGKDGMST